MSLQQLRNVNFGRLRLDATGSSGVGYQLLDQTGSIVSSRTTSGVYQTAPGIYAAYVSFPDNFRGQILWDTGTYFPTASYATEQYNVEENDPRVADTNARVISMQSDIDRLVDIQYGRWKILNNQMVFYKEDNSTVVATYDLFDDTGLPTMDAVFDRVKV